MLLNYSEFWRDISKKGKAQIIRLNPLRLIITGDEGG